MSAAANDLRQPPGTRRAESGERHGASPRVIPNVHPSAPDGRVICDIRKNKQESARIQLRTFEATRLVDVRCYVHREDGEMLPSKKGICVRVQLLDELIQALCDARTAARQMGWVSEDPEKRKAA
jgi:hypothetical protein